MIERDQRHREAGRGGRRRRPASTPRPGEVPGAAIRADATVTFETLQGRARRRARPLPRRRRPRGADRPRRRRRTSTRSLAPSVLDRRPAQDGDEHEVPRRARARRRRLAGAHRGARRSRRWPRSGPTPATSRWRCPSRRCRGRGPRARGGQAAAARGLRPGRLLARSAERCSSSPSAPTRSCSGPASAGATARATSCWSLLERLTVPVVLDADALWELEPFLAVGADGDDPARRRARAAARDRRGGDRRPPARVGAAGRVALRLHRAAEGRRHARRLAARGRARADLRRCRPSRRRAPETCSPA